MTDPFPGALSQIIYPHLDEYEGGMIDVYKFVMDK